MHVLPRGAEVNDIVNIAAIAAVDAQKTADSAILLRYVDPALVSFQHQPLLAGISAIAQRELFEIHLVCVEFRAIHTGKDWFTSY